MAQGKGAPQGDQRNEEAMEGGLQRLLLRSNERVWVLPRGQESDTVRLAFPRVWSGCGSGSGSWRVVGG